MLKILLLVALIKLLLASHQPLWCAGIYTAFSLFFGIVYGASFPSLMLVGALGFGLAYLYFWLLKRFEGSVWFWVTMVGGLGIGLV